MATFIQEVEGFKGKAALYEHEGFQFIVSSTSVLGIPETLVFLAEQTAEKTITVASWSEVAGGKLLSRAEAVMDLERLSAADIREFIGDCR